MSATVRGIASGIDVNKIIDELMAIERRPVRRNADLVARAESMQGLWRDIAVRFDLLQRSLAPLLSRSTFSTLVASASDPSRVEAAVTGRAVSGSYCLQVDRTAARHSVAMGPAAGTGAVGDPAAALGLSGAFFLGRGKPAAGVEALVFSQAESAWLRGSLSSGYQAVLDGDPSTAYPLSVDRLQFAEGYAAGMEIRVYLEAFIGSGGGEGMDTLAAYYAGAGAPLEPDQPYFTIRRDEGTAWRVYGRDGGHPFTLAGDHPSGSLSLRADIVDASANTLAGHRFTLRLGGELDPTGLITVRPGDSLNQVAQRVNAATAVTGISASVVKRAEGDWRLVLESRVEGSAGHIQAVRFTPLNGAEEELYGAADILGALGLAAGEPDGVSTRYAYQIREAADALFSFNGLPVERSSNTVADLAAGVTFTLRGTGEARVEVRADLARPREAIDRFITAYNDLNSILRAMLDRKSGPLQGEASLMRLERQLRRLVHGRLEQGGEALPYRSLADLGITADNAEGFLSVNETRIGRALEEDLTAVFGFFSFEGGSGGLARQLEGLTAVAVGRNGVIPGRKAYLDRSITQLEKQAAAWEDRLARREANLVRRFTFMEQYIARMQEQTGLLTSFEVLWNKAKP